MSNILFFLLLKHEKLLLFFICKFNYDLDGWSDITLGFWEYFDKHFSPFC